MGRPKKHIYNSDETAFEGGDETIEECKICHQEFTGLCPLNSARCPYVDKIETEDDDDEDVEADFDDVAKIDGVLDDDKEAEKLIDESGDGPPPDGDFKDTRYWKKAE